MSAPHQPQGRAANSHGHSATAGRRCPGCNSALATDNTARLCGRCHREQRDQLLSPPVHLKDEFFETDEFRFAFASQQIGQVLKAYRHHPRHLEMFGKALNQDLLGKWLGLTQAQVSKLETGEREEYNLLVLRDIAKRLCLPRGRLWFDFAGDTRFAHIQTAEIREVGPAQPKTTQEWLDPSFSNYTQLNGKDFGVALVKLAATESAKFGLRHQVGEIHASTMEQIEEEVRRLSVDFISGDPFDTFMRSRRLRNDIFTLLEQRVFPKQEQLLYGFAARTCGYLAAASSDFYGSYDAAADQIRTARRFADVAEFPELRAWTLGLQSGISFWHGDFVRAATFAERSLELAVTRSGVMRATAMRARALARIGDSESLHAVIETADHSPIDSRSDEENGMILFSELNHKRCIGTANLWAGESEKARDQLAQSLDDYLRESPSNFAVIATIRADIALSFLKQRDVQGAADAIAPLLDVESDRRLEGAFRRMRNLQAILQAPEYSGTSDSRDLSSQIEEFLASSADSRKPAPEEM